MTRGDKIAEARRLRDEGFTQTEIAKRLGVAVSTIWGWLNPEALKEKRRQDNANRATAKLEWDKRKQRDPAWRGRCERCRQPMGIGYAADGVCRSCRSEEVQFRFAQIEKWWQEGLMIREIGARLGFSKDRMAVEIDRARKAGYDLAKRRPFGHKAAA